VGSRTPVAKRKDWKATSKGAKRKYWKATKEMPIFIRHYQND
jgi:hypothetical protein